MYNAPATSPPVHGADGESEPRGGGRLAPMNGGQPSGPAVDRVDYDSSYDPQASIECEVCGSEMRYIAACKILCSNCGYRRDCSDP